METQIKASPETLTDFAEGQLELVKRIERLIEGLDQLNTAAIVDRMLADGADEYVAAFHGLTYAWVLAVMPELEEVMHFDATDYRTTMVLQRYKGDVRRGTDERYRFEFIIPKELRYVDDEWSGREVEA